METALAEADAAVDSNPVDEGVSQESAAQATEASDSGETSAGVPPTDAAAGDRDAQVLARLDKGEAVRDIRQNPKPVEPSAKASQEKGQNGAAESKAGKGAEHTPAADPDYQGVDAKALNALRRAELLPAPEDWKELSQKGRAALAAAANRILRDRGRISQQIGQAKAAPTNQNDGLQSGAEEEQTDQDLDGTVEEPPRYTAEQWAAQQQAAQQPQRGARAQTQPTARSAAQPPLADELKPFKETFGDDAVAPLERIFTRQQEALAQAQSVIEQQNASHQQVVESLSRKVFEPEEREAFKNLETTTGSKLTAQQRETIKVTAFHFMQASSQVGEESSWQQAIERAGRAVLNPDITQKAQQNLLNRRDERLRATPTKAAGIPRAARSLSQDDKDSAAFALLEQGRSVAEVRSSFRE